MADLVANLRLGFGVTPEPVTFALEVDQRDSFRNGAVLVEELRTFSRIWTDQEFIDYYKDKNVLKVIENGYAHVRLYAPDDIEVRLVPTELPSALSTQKRFVWRTSIAGPTQRADLFLLGENGAKNTGLVVGQRIAQPAPAEPEYVGRYESLIVDTIAFSNQRLAHPRYNHVKRGFEVAYASDFITPDGRRLEPPVWVPELNGAFILPEPATGVIVIRYLAPYRLYRVHYGLPSGVEFPELQLAWLKGNIAAFPMPRVKVIAIAAGAGRVAETDIEKVVHPPGATMISSRKKDELDKGLNLTERSRTTETVRVTDEADPSKFIDIQSAKEVTLVNADGVAYVLRFK
jgi:hypothetical protein